MSTFSFLSILAANRKREKKGLKELMIAWRSRSSDPAWSLKLLSVLSQLSMTAWSCERQSVSVSWVPVNYNQVAALFIVASATRAKLPPGQYRPDDDKLYLSIYLS